MRLQGPASLRAAKEALEETVNDLEIYRSACVLQKQHGAGRLAVTG